jgi:hypothetical protein
MSKNEITTTDTGYLSLKDFNLADMMSQELDGLQGGFERIKIPSAGSTVFEVPGDNPSEPDTFKEFTAVILFHHPLYAFYKSKYTGGNQPPDCGSMDGVTGVGDPGGSCMNCPYNQFGSGENGSKACKNRRRIYVLRESEIFPMILSLPTGSLKEFSRYIKRLLSKGRKSNSVVTRFSLKKTTNSGGITFSQAQFAIDRVLSPQEHALIEALSEQVKAYSQDFGYEPEGTDAPAVDMETGEVIQPLE